MVNRLVEIVHRVDKVGDEMSISLNRKYASASEMVRLITALTKVIKTIVQCINAETGGR